MYFKKCVIKRMIKSNKYLKKLTLENYIREQKYYLLTSRFSNDTWEQNESYRKERNITCIYSSPDPISQHIPLDSIMFILEMNNDNNKIMGIGMVRNRAHVNRHFVYTNGNYNRYNFVGRNRIDRDEMNEEEENVMKAFDILCFTGNKHMKRGQGLKSFPTEMLFNCSKKLDLVDFIKKMFKCRI